MINPFKNKKGLGRGLSSLIGDSDLKTAMKMIAKTQKGPDEQIPSMGCNIKWFN